MLRKLIILCLALIVFFVGCKPKKNQKLTIATAASMQFAMEELVVVFEKETAINCEPIISSSGKLAAQIRAGAPFDIFVSADLDYPNNLFKDGHTSENPEIYAYGRLVMWSMDESNVPSIDLLGSTYVEHIAVANPKTAPYGKAAISALKYYNMLDQVEDKLVYGESIAQANQFVTTGAAQICFTAKAVVLSPQMKGKGSWKEVDSIAYKPIAQGVVLLENGNNSSEARQFYNFLFSEKGKAVLAKFGYL